jgi:hypothetical protein
MTLNLKPMAPFLQTLKFVDREQEKKQKIIKRTKKSRGRGKRGESGVAKVLSTWFGMPESFLPSKSSGAGNRIGQAGDIAAPLGFIPIIEIKNDESWNTTNLFTYLGARGAVQPIWKFWKQALGAVEDYKKKKTKNMIDRIPWLIFTKNYDSYLLLMTKHDFDNNFFHYPDNFGTLQVSLENSRQSIFIICILEDFLDVNTPTKLMKPID